MVEQLCDWVAVVNAGRVIAQGPLDSVRGGRSLHEAFLELIGVREDDGQALGWLGGGHSGSAR